MAAEDALGLDPIFLIMTMRTTPPPKEFVRDERHFLGVN